MFLTLLVGLFHDSPAGWGGVMLRFPVRLEGLACLSILAVMIVCTSGCGGDPFPFDALALDPGGSDSDIANQDSCDEDMLDAPQQITFISPDPAGRPVIHGTYEVVFRYDDEAGLPAVISIGYVRQADVTPVVLKVDGPGEYAIDMDTTGLIDGNESFLVTAVSEDGRTIAKKGKVLLDNNPPVIEFLEPTPPEGAGFVDELPIRVRVTDSGSLLNKVTITAGEFVWTWPPDETEVEPATQVDTRTVISENAGTFEDLVIPTTGWRGGDITLTVTASDGVAGRDAVATRPLFFVEMPGLDGGEFIEPDVDDQTYLEAVEGIRLGPADDGDWAVMATIRDKLGYRLGLLQRSQTGELTETGTVIAESCPLRRIVDINHDGMDDVLAWCGGGTMRRILILEQAVGREFVETKTIYTNYRVKDVAAGDLNDDGVPDIAFVSSVEPLWTGIALSTVDGYGDFAGYEAPRFYSGAVKPDHVAIGRFSDDAHNSVIVGATGSSILTAYPMDENGVPSMGENSSLDPDNQAVDDVSAMAAVNFAHIGGAANALVVADSKNVPVMGIATLRQDNSRRVESIGERVIGSGAKDIAVGDINGDGAPDAAILCPGSHMVAVFMGKKLAEGAYPVSDGEFVLSGPATDLTLADMNMDGYLDIVLMTGNRQLKIIYYSVESGKARFDASHQAIVPQAPTSVATGHFVKPLSGEGAEFLDAAALYMVPPPGGNSIAVYSSDAVIGQPTRPTGSVGLDVNTAQALRAGNFDVDIAAGVSDPMTRPDDLIVTTAEAASELKPNQARLILFHEGNHDAISFTVNGVKPGDMPLYAAVGEFDLDPSSPATMDVAFLTKNPPGSPQSWLVQVMLGNMTGALSTTSEDVGLIAPIPVAWKLEPMQLKSYPLRRSLKKFLDGGLSQPDLMLINELTRDVTLFLGMGFGLFQDKTMGSHDFSAGGKPLDVAAGYLRARIDEGLDDGVAANLLPDLVTLVQTHVLVDYSLDRQALKEMGEDIGFEPPLALAVVGSNPIAVEVADMNVDGMYDIVVLDSSASSILVFPNLGQHRFAAPYLYSTGKSPVSMSIADVDADGCPDVVTADREGKTVSTLHNATQLCRDGE